MKTIVTFILGFFVGKWWARRKSVGGSGLNSINEQRHKEAEENKAKVLELAKDKEFITNDDVQSALNVSDTSATRYLDELEKEGKLEQIGHDGRFVKYRIK